MFSTTLFLLCNRGRVPQFEEASLPSGPEARFVGVGPDQLKRRPDMDCPVAASRIAGFRDGGGDDIGHLDKNGEIEERATMVTSAVVPPS